MSQVTKCDKCGEEYEHTANYLHTELRRSGTCMIDVQVEIRHAGFRRDICDNCVFSLLDELLNCVTRPSGAISEDQGPP